MIIQNRRQIPTVSVTGKPGHRQLRIAFNAALVRAAKLDGFEFMAVESGTDGDVRFIPSKTILYRSKKGEEGQAFSLSPDGGNKGGTARALYVSKATFSFLPTGKYSSVINKDNSITISYGEK